MKIKVCGITQKGQVRSLDLMGIDMIGFNFYPKSKRFIKEPEKLAFSLKHSKKVAVFVNAHLDEILNIYDIFPFDYAQLHGLQEDRELCTTLQKHNIGVIKVFSNTQIIDDKNICSPFADVVDFFLIDTHTKHYGGSGKIFDWSMLEGIDFPKPFILSGGISMAEVAEIKGLAQNVKILVGIDINSRFEKEEGIKNMASIARFQQLLNDE